MTTPVPVRNRTEVLLALQRASSLEAAAAAVGFTIRQLHAYAYANHFGVAFERVRREGRYFAHPGFVDMSGRSLFSGALVVVARARNDLSSNACWRVRWTACGHEGTKQGTELRAREKSGLMFWCPVCRAEARA